MPTQYDANVRWTNQQLMKVAPPGSVSKAWVRCAFGHVYVILCEWLMSALNYMSSGKFLLPLKQMAFSLSKYRKIEGPDHKRRSSPKMNLSLAKVVSYYILFYYILLYYITSYYILFKNWVKSLISLILSHLGPNIALPTHSCCWGLNVVTLLSTGCPKKPHQ